MNWIGASRNAARRKRDRPETVVALIRRLCKEGMALLVASSELEEIVAFSHRVAVLRDRRNVGEIAGDDITRENIVRTIAGR